MVRIDADPLREIADVHPRRRLLQAVEPVAKLGPHHHHSVLSRAWLTPLLTACRREDAPLWLPSR